jgi:hypothetical protein
MANRRPVVKRGYVIAKDLKAVGEMVPQLKDEGYVKWSNGFKDAAGVMGWQESLLDLHSEYEIDGESNSDEINRTVAWLLLIRTTEGYEDLIEEEVQAGQKDFVSAYRTIHYEFNRVTTSNMNALNMELFSATMEGTQLSVRAFAADLVRKSRKINELAPGSGFNELQLLSIFMKGLPMEYKELVQHLSFKKLDSLREAVDITRDFAIANRLENEAGVNLAATAPRKVHQVFSMSGGGGGARQEQQECRHYRNTGKCKYGTKCRYKHVGSPRPAPTSVKTTKKPSGGAASQKKFEGECFHCGKKGHRRVDCHRKKREDLEAND